MENELIIKALKKVKETQWVGNTTHTNMDKALRGINLESSNSGWYNPKPIRVPGVYGWFMENENGSIFFEYRIIKKDDSSFIIETMTNTGYDNFEKEYIRLRDIS